MMQHMLTNTDLHTDGQRITVEVLGRQKPVATVYPDGLEVWCKVFSSTAKISYEQLMAVPAFRAGVQAVLKSEQGE